MNRLLALVVLVLAFAIPVPAVASSHHTASKPPTSSNKVYVHGYYRKDGTYVPPHYRTAPSSAQSSSSGSTSGGSATGSHQGGCSTCPRDANGKIKRSEAAKKAFMKQSGYPNGRPGYVVDHIVPLECGGADDPSNMQWQTKAAAKAKDRTEGNCRH